MLVGNTENQTPDAVCIKEEHIWVQLQLWGCSLIPI